MQLIESQTRIKHLCLMAMTAVFAAASAQGVGGCENTGGKLERVAARAPSTESSDSPDKIFVQDKSPRSEEAAVGSLLALHCEAVSNLPLGRVMPVYHRPVCGESGLESAMR